VGRGQGVHGRQVAGVGGVQDQQRVAAQPPQVVQGLHQREAHPRNTRAQLWFTQGPPQRKLMHTGARSAASAPAQGTPGTAPLRLL